MLRAEKLKTIPSVKIREYGSNSKRIMLRSRQKGSILLGIIITMVVMASLGAGMVYLTTTSTFQELFANNHARAYYAAESGGRYATARIREAYAQTTTAARDAILATIPGTYYDGTATNNKGNFLISALAGTTGSPAIVTFTSTGTVNSGFLQAKRLLNYSIQPANQTGGGTSAQTIIPPLSPADLGPLAGTADPKSIVSNTVSGDQGVTITPNPGGAKLAIVVPLGNSIQLTENYSVQIKTASPSQSKWMMGMLFNLDPNSAATTGFPDGYGLTYTFNSSSDDPNIYGTMPSGDLGSPMIILWQSVTVAGSQTYNWIAYKKLDGSPNPLPGYLTNTGGNYQLQNDAVALVAQVTRTASSNIIRVYYGSPNPDHTQLGVGIGDAIAINDTRLYYNLSSPPNIQWPVPTASWTATTDYFTLVQWDNYNSSVATSPGTGSELGAVITSTVLTDTSKYNGVALYLNASSMQPVDFFDLAIYIPPTTGGSGSGSVIQY